MLSESHACLWRSEGEGAGERFAQVTATGACHAAVLSLNSPSGRSSSSGVGLTATSAGAASPLEGRRRLQRVLPVVARLEASRRRRPKANQTHVSQLQTKRRPETGPTERSQLLRRIAVRAPAAPATGHRAWELTCRVGV